MLAQLACVLVGLWLMAAPAILGYGDPARASDRIVGPLVAAVACTAISAVVRDVRRVNLLAAAWLLVAPWVLGYGLAPAINSTVAGARRPGHAAVRWRLAGTLAASPRARTIARSPFAPSPRRAGAPDRGLQGPSWSVPCKSKGSRQDAARSCGPD
jgi:hypothetical protein